MFLYTLLDGLTQEHILTRVCPLVQGIQHLDTPYTFYTALYALYFLYSLFTLRNL